MRNLIIIGVALLVLVGGTYGVLSYSGMLTSKPKPKPVVQYPKTWVPVPVTFRQMPAGTEITRELLTDPKSGRLVSRPYNPKDIAANHVMTLKQLDHRVLKHDLHPGHWYTEDDFLPLGARPGPSVLIPSDKRAVTLTVTKTLGVRSLISGDHVDLICAQKYDPSHGHMPKGFKPPVGPPVPIAYVQILAQNAVVIKAVSIEQLVTGGTPAKPKYKLVENIEVAVDPKEVAGVYEAVSAAAEINFVLHSAQLKGDDDKLLVPPTPQPPPDPKPVVIATIKGRNQGAVTFTTGDEVAAAEQPADQKVPANGDQLPTIPAVAAPEAQ